MKDEPFFLVNEFLEREQKELKEVLKIIKVENYRENQKSVFLKNFTNEAFKAYRKNKDKMGLLKAEEKKLDFEKESLLKKRKLVLDKLKELEKVEVKEITAPLPSQEKQVILSKETGKTLVKTEFDGKNYNVIEPILNLEYLKLIDELKELNLDSKDELKQQVGVLCNKYKINYTDDYFDKIRYYLVRDVKKYGKISALIEDKDVKDIICSGSGKLLSVNYKDQDDVGTNIIFNSEDEVNNFIKFLGKKGEQKFSLENPFLEFSFDGLKIQGNLGSEFIKGKFAISKN